MAIIGSGISGLTAAYLLHEKYNIDVFEESGKIGGHTATVDVEYKDKTYSLDTGFIIFNDKNYPNLNKFFTILGIDRYPISMGFSVYDKQKDIEYSVTGVNGYFSQRKNIFLKQHWKLLKEIISFNKKVSNRYAQGNINPKQTLQDFVRKNGYSDYMLALYIVPMCSAIWSSNKKSVEEMPFQFFAQFFINHGLLNKRSRMQWYTVKGCARSYLVPLSEPFRDTIFLNTSVSSVAHRGKKVGVTLQGGKTKIYDYVVVATHSSQALAMLTNVTTEERSILGSIQFQQTEVVVHYDDRILPKHKRTWESWNCGVGTEGQQMISYNSNQLHNIDAPVNFWVTVNPDCSIDESKILSRHRYEHPLFTHVSTGAQERLNDINGKNNIWYVGAYWGNGFHEDGINSALRAAKSLGIGKTIFD